LIKISLRCFLQALEKDGEEQLDPSVKNEEILPRVKEERNFLHSIKRRKASWIGHILFRNFLFKRFIEEQIEGNTEGIRRRGKRYKQLLDDIKENKTLECEC
jgi:hypothetical protein